MIFFEGQVLFIEQPSRGGSGLVSGRAFTPDRLSAARRASSKRYADSIP
jgi:hypothetical protein